MTMKNSELYEQIEAYLTHTLPADERQALEQRLAEDESLRQEVALHRQMHLDYNAGRLKLRASLRDVMQEQLPPDTPSASGNKLRWGLWLIGIAGIVCIAVWASSQRTKPAPVVPAPAPVETPPPYAPAPAPKTAPIAMTDPARFKPNPGMEAFVRSDVRSESIQVKLSRPLNDAHFIPDAKGLVALRFTGFADLPEDQADTELVLSFFDNRNANQAIQVVPVSGQKGVDHRLKFDLAQSLKFQPGLYYFTIEQRDKGEILYAGRFLIGE